MKNKGFTLIEVLVSIVIIGLLASIGVVGFSSIFSKAETNYYEIMEDSVLMSANDFFQDHRDMLPLSDYNEVPVSELIAGKYVEQLKDKSGNECSGGSVFIYRNEDGSYRYEVCLVCGNYQSNGSFCESGGTPIVTIEGRRKVTGTPYLASCNYIEEVDNESVVIDFSTKRDVKKYIIKNKTNNTQVTCNTADNRTCSMEFDTTGTYQVTGYDSANNAVTKERTFCIKIKTNAPEFDIFAQGLSIITDNSATKTVEFEIQNINQNISKREYRISTLSESGTYKTFTGNTFSEVLGSGSDYLLEVKLTNNYGLETVKSFGFDVGYLVSLNYGGSVVETNLVVVKGLSYGAMDERLVNYPEYINLIGKLPAQYNGTKISWTYGETKVSDDFMVTEPKRHTLNIKYDQVAKNDSYCEDLTYNGTEQILANSTEKITFSNNVATAAGNYNVTGTLADGIVWDDGTNDPYTFACQIKQLNIGDGSVSGLTSAVYTGSAITQNPVVKFNDKNLVLNTDYTVAYTNNINVGKATVTITGIGNYKGTLTGNFDITKAIINVPDSPSDKPYTGSSQNHGVNVPAHTSIVTSGSTLSATNVGNYQIKIKLDDTNNYKWSDNSITNKTVNWSIIAGSKATITCQNKTYNGESQIIATCTGCTGSLTNASKTAAGTYTVSGTADSNHTAPDSKSCKITAKAVTVTATDQSKNWDDSALTANNTCSISGQVSGHTVTCTGNTGSQTAAGSSAKTVGTAKISDASGNDVTSNYSVTKNNGTLTVSKVKAVITCQNKTYNGGSQAIATCTGCTGSLTNGSKTTVGTYTVSGIADSNHTAPDSKSCKITTKAVTVTATNQSKNWDGSALTANNTCSISGQVSGHTVTCTGNTGSQTAVGSSIKTVGTAKIYDASGNDVTSNYSVNTSVGTLTVSAVKAVITCQNKTYNGGSQTIATCTGCTGSLTNGSETAAGTYTVSGTADSNHTAPDNKSCKVTTKAVTVTATDQSKNWDGSALTANNTCSISGQVSGHTVTCTGNTGSQTAVGSSAKTLGTVKISDASGNDVTSNYSVTKNNGTLTVSAVKAVITCQDKTYNGGSQTIATCTGCTGSLTNGSETAAGTYTVSGTADSNHTAPDNKDCSISALSIDSASISSVGTYKYTGSAITPSPTVTMSVGGNTVTLTKDTDYTFSYANNVNRGTATIKATGKGNFTGSKSTTFSIVTCSSSTSTSTASSCSVGSAPALSGSYISACSSYCKSTRSVYCKKKDGKKGEKKWNTITKSDCASSKAACQAWNPGCTYGVYSNSGCSQASGYNVTTTTITCS